MDPDRQRIEADLRGLLAGEVHCDDVFVQMYSTDASIYEVRPLGVVRPRTESDVVECVRYAHQHGIPISARGAGTGLAGESLGTGLVMDFSHSMRRILHTGTDTVRVQPGVTLAQLNEHLATQGRMFGPDPATSAVTTMGSVLAVDASGSHWLQHGSARSHTLGMRVVLDDGEIISVRRESLDQVTRSSKMSKRHHELVTNLAELLNREAEIIEKHQPQSLVNRCGYQLLGVVDDQSLDLCQLLVGSEGTLALTVEAELRTEPISAHRAVSLLMFDRLEQAAVAALMIPPLGATACDLMDRRILALARETDVRFDLLIPEGTEALLVVETQGETESEVRGQLQEIVDRVIARKHLAFDARIAADSDEAELYWSLARHVVPNLYRLIGSNRPLPFVEDMAVPPEILPEFLVKIQNVLKQHHVTASVFSHAGHGQLHVRPFLDLANPQHVQTMQRLAADFYEQVFDVGGTISGEHGDGYSRTPFVAQQYGPVYAVFREIKRIFDPHNIFNPGKVVSDDPDLLTKHLRPLPDPNSVDSNFNHPKTLASLDTEPELPRPVTLQLNWQDENIAVTTQACNGCGQCRTHSVDTRMCPMFRFAPREEASPRAKANLIRAVLTGRLDPAELSGEQLKSLSDLCVNCHQCRLECPASVDIPKLMVESKAQYVANNGLRISDLFLARLDVVSYIASMSPRLTNWALGNPQMRWLLEKIFGLAQGRKVPKLANVSFMRYATRRRLTRPTRRSGRKVLYFVDTYANWYDVQLAQALIAVLEHNGVAVYVHPKQKQSAMALISIGAMDLARRIADTNVDLLAEAVRQGYEIVATEPAAALAMKHEYLNFVDNVEDARLVADHTSEASSYLWKMHQNGDLRLDFKPLNLSLTYHQPCHMKAITVGSPSENLLKLIPGLRVSRFEHGCSGMAGTFGFQRDNYRSSLRAGWSLIAGMRHPNVHVGTTECSTCRLQMRQGTAKPTVHPLKVIALAYGVMPEIESLFSSRHEELVVS